MKKIFLITAIVAAIIILVVFNKMTSKSTVDSTFVEVKKGLFEMVITNSGELLAENSVDISGPELGQPSNQGPNQNRSQGNNQGGSQRSNQGSSQGGSQGNSQGGGAQRSPQGGGQGGGPRGPQGQGSDMRAMMLKIQDIVPEGTMVKEGDFIAQLDRSSFDNTLKDELENLKTFQTNLEMKILDTAVVLTNLRDNIKNQKFIMDEAAITLSQSKYESPATVRQAEINLDKAKRTLEQQKRGYELAVAQIIAQISRQKIMLDRRARLVSDLQEYLDKFTITAPSPGMVIYKKERNGTKRKAGSTLNPFDLVVASLPDLSSLMSKTFISEVDISKIKVGQAVNIKIDAFPDKKFNGKVYSIANIGEKLPNTNDKVFEVNIKLDYTDPSLRPSMTTSNKIILQTYNDAVFVPIECIQAGADSIPFVFTKNGLKQIVLIGGSNDKNTIIEEGLKPGTMVYLTNPERPEKFKLAGDEFIPVIKERERQKRARVANNFKND